MLVLDTNHVTVLGYASEPATRLLQKLEFFAAWLVLPWDTAAAANLFVRFRGEGIRIGSMDLKIACITLVHDATLLTQNARDFGSVPGLRVENWLD